MSKLVSRISSEIDFNLEGKQVGFLRLPHSVHRSAYGWIPIPVACIKNGEGPTVLLMAGNACTHFVVAGLRGDRR